MRTTLQRNKLFGYRLSDDEWDILNELCTALALFADASEMLSGSSYPCLGMAYPVLDSLHYYLNSTSVNDVEECIKCALNETFEKYMRHPNDSPEHKLLLLILLHYGLFKAGGVPLLALCCLGLLGLLFAGIIVIALIPLYLKRRDINGRQPTTWNGITSGLRVENAVAEMTSLVPEGKTGVSDGFVIDEAKRVKNEVVCVREDEDGAEWLKNEELLWFLFSCSRQTMMQL
ncbi:unnamed protein product [Didymodactylos carnosus]|uniref:Uncharacterized protein n=1 Tax=Didymodactylos carnosus TaxID=1234261 RepID=A0A8S2H2J4_9BILA|nr:unnamed protein product [Didymodactylos carnosus]CAF3592814.1 unnamed protein product [Didymodactylos carnosus]